MTPADPKTQRADARETQRLASIAALGRDFADFLMRDQGFITPGLVGICHQGYFLFAPREIVSSKDRAFFDLAAKLICVAYEAVGAAIVIEATMSPAKAAHGRTAVIRSNTTAGGVLILSETRAHSARTMLHVLRSDAGDYLGLEESASQDFQINSGRYKNFVPRKEFNPDFIKQTRNTMRTMKLDVQLHTEHPFQ